MKQTKIVGNELVTYNIKLNTMELKKVRKIIMHLGIDSKNKELLFGWTNKLLANNSEVVNYLNDYLLNLNLIENPTVEINKLKTACYMIKSCVIISPECVRSLPIESIPGAMLIQNKTLTRKKSFNPVVVLEK